MKHSVSKIQIKMKRLAVLCVISVSLTLILSCLEESQDQDREQGTMVREIQLLINQQKFEAARLAAIDTLDPEVRSLYYKADKYLAHASHQDVECNERIEKILHDIAGKVPVKNTTLNRDIYAELLALYPENQLYKKKFIYYDRKARGMVGAAN